MKKWQKPQLASFGTVADITKGKIGSGTDAFSGGQAQPGGCVGVGTVPVYCNDTSSHDGVIDKWK